MSRRDSPRPTRSQYALTREITRWYLGSYYLTEHDVGVPAMYCRRDRVGEFAIEAAELAAGEPQALFRLLVTMIMFQRRSDLQIMRVLRGIRGADAHELTDAPTLLSLVDEAPCGLVKTLDGLIERCDLAKDPKTKRGRCGAAPGAPCHLKRHTELLKRYGHFGKVPSAAALTLRAHGVQTLPQLRTRVWAECSDPRARAVRLERALCRSWRISDKISAMFLSAVCNPALSEGLAPWAEGVDAERFVVIDSNVDLALRAMSYDGPMTYSARRAFIQRLAARIRLDELRGGLAPYNPRVVQQALYTFMSESNRRANPGDCAGAAPSSCSACPPRLGGACPRKPAAARVARA